MSKRFRVEHNDMEKGVLYITLHHPPYNDEDVLSKINWKQKKGSLGFPLYFII